MLVPSMAETIKNVHSWDMSHKHRHNYRAFSINNCRSTIMLCNSSMLTHFHSLQPLPWIFYWKTIVPNINKICNYYYNKIILENPFWKSVYFTNRRYTNTHSVYLPVTVKAVQRIRPVTRWQLTAKIADIQRSHITQVGSLGEERERLLWGQKLLIQRFRHGKSVPKIEEESNK